MCQAHLQGSEQASCVTRMFHCLLVVEPVREKVSSRESPATPTSKYTEQSWRSNTTTEWSLTLTVLPGDVATHGGIVHLAGRGEGEDVGGARHTPGGGGGAVAQTELVKVQPDLTDVVCLSLDEVDTGPSRLVGGGEAGVLQLSDVGGDAPATSDQPHHTARPEPTSAAALRLTTLENILKQYSAELFYRAGLVMLTSIKNIFLGFKSKKLNSSFRC